MSKKLEVSLTVPALAEFVGVVRLAVSGIAARLNFAIEEIEDIKVAVSEACTNAIQHAYGATPNGDEIIEIKAYIEGGSLEIIVKDFGQGFDLSILGTSFQKKQSQEKMGLGLGLTFIKSLMDDTDFSSKIGEGTVIQMKKKSPNLETSPVT